jgi:transposase-like protein
MVRVVTEELMQEEVCRHLGAAPHEPTRSRRGHRNGYKPRTLNTRLGKLGFEVPQGRGTEPYQPMFFERWQRSLFFLSFRKERNDFGYAKPPSGFT